MSSPLRKKPRLSTDEARVALIEAGKKLLVRRGLDTGLGLVTLNDAIVESGVPRASAYRVFSAEDVDPQVAFRRDLLITYIDGDPLEERRTAARTILDETLVALATDDPRQLAAAVRESVRVGFAGTVAGLLDDPNWRIIGPSWAATALIDWAPEELVDAHRAAKVAEANYYIPLYRQVAQACGLRLRAPQTWETWALLVDSTITVPTFYARYHPELRVIDRATGPDGGLQPWSHAAVLVEGLVLSSFEPDPAATVHADLSTWLAR